jgi:hypothetical protein
MQRENFNDHPAFLAVARERSFTIKVEITIDHSLTTLSPSVMTPACDPASNWRRT